MTPRSIADFGIPNTAEDGSSCAIASPPRRSTAPAPAAPSLPIPVSTTATPARPAVAAMLVEQDVTGRAVVPRNGVPVEGQPPGDSQREVRALRREPDPGACRRAGRGDADRHADGLVQPADQAVGETGGDVLHDQDRDRVVGGQRVEQAHQHLGTAN